MWKSSLSAICVSICALCVFSALTPAAGIPALPMHIQYSDDQNLVHNGGQQEVENRERITELPNSFTLIVPEAMPPIFENGTSLLRGNVHKRFHRDKREACKERPENEIMKYYGLELPNRCWDDCDCRSGRYCTKHSWCHDLPRE